MSIELTDTLVSRKLSNGPRQQTDRPPNRTAQSLTAHQASLTRIHADQILTPPAKNTN
jgi:hypothetical protein